MGQFQTKGTCTCNKPTLFTTCLYLPSSINTQDTHTSIAILQHLEQIGNYYRFIRNKFWKLYKSPGTVCRTTGEMFRDP